jgi:Uma2 family endonuclease
MATAAKPLTLEEFRSQYGGRKPHFEYWFGEAIQKSMPTWLHALVQSILGEMLRRAGYKVGSELELRIDPQWEPVPDVAATLRRLEQPYPTKPLEIVVEILSPDDRMSQVLSKCRHSRTDKLLPSRIFGGKSQNSWNNPTPTPVPQKRKR